MTQREYEEVDRAVRLLESKINWYPIASALYHELLDEYLKIRQESARLNLSLSSSEVF